MATAWVRSIKSPFEPQRVPSQLPQGHKKTSVLRRFSVYLPTIFATRSAIIAGVTAFRQR